MNPVFSNPREEAEYWKKKALEYKTSLEETKDEFKEFQSGSRDLELELETQLEQQETRCSDLCQQNNRLTTENQILKERLQKGENEFCGELTKLQEELIDIKNNKERLIKYIRELEQTNDDLERTKRATVASLEDFETKFNLAIERNAVLESELDEKEALKGMVQRLKDEARDLRQEVSVQRQKEVTNIPDNDAFMIQSMPKSRIPVNNSSLIDSNKLTDHLNNDFKSNSALNRRNLNKNVGKSDVPIVSPSRVKALNIVGDLLRRVGTMENRLASCRTLVKENHRPINESTPTNRSSR